MESDVLMTSMNTDTHDNLDMNECEGQFPEGEQTCICVMHLLLIGLEDGSMSGILSPAVVLPNEQDLQMLLDGFKAFISW